MHKGQRLHCYIVTNQLLILAKKNTQMTHLNNLIQVTLDNSNFDLLKFLISRSEIPVPIFFLI
jgi:hypothetical protein